MKKIWSIVVFVVALLATSMVNGGEPPSEAELKARFSQRHQALERLKDGAKVGETTAGLVEVVRDAYARENVKLPEGKTTTVGAFLRAENTDRRLLYEVIGERTGESADSVAQQAAIRNFRQAKPNHYLKLRNGQWMQKKQLPEPKEKPRS